MNTYKSIFRLLKLNKASAWKIVVLTVTSVVASLAGVAVALLTKTVVDSAIAGDMPVFWRYAAYLAALAAVQIGLSFLAKYLLTKVSATIDLFTKKLLYCKLLRSDYASVGAYHSGVLMSRLNDDVRIVSSGLTQIIPGLFGTVARLVAAFVAVLLINYKFALAFLALGICAMFGASLMRKKLQEIHRKEQESTEKVSSFMQESISNILMIKAFGAEDVLWERGDALQEDRRKAIRRRNIFSSLAGLFMNVAFYGGYILGMIWCAVQIASGTITVGMFSAMLQLISQVERPLTTIAGIIPQLASLNASADRICELLDLPGEPEDKKNPEMLYADMQWVGLRNADFAYDRDLVLQSADFTLKKGEFAVLCGVSGIGKSTLMKLLLGVYPLKNGKIILQSEGGETPIDSTTRSLFAYVPQGSFLLSGTIRENITLMNPSASDETIWHALEICDAREFIDALPQGLDTVIGERGVGLSEGQIQRLAIARALLLDAPILLLDESTSALDEVTEERVLKNLRTMTDKTCLLISHKRAALAVCDHAYTLEDGRVLLREKN